MDAAQPQRYVFPERDPLGALVANVRDALGALPVYFRTATRIEGLEGGELFNLSAVLGSAIEVQVVETLNRIRQVRDPDDHWPRHRFVRSAQTFPDVRLLTENGDAPSDIALGVELKGWYLLPAGAAGPADHNHKLAPTPGCPTLACFPRPDQRAD